MAIGYDKIKNIQWFSLFGKFLSGMSFLQFMPIVYFLQGVAIFAKACLGASLPQQAAN